MNRPTDRADHYAHQRELQQAFAEAVAPLFDRTTAADLLTELTQTDTHTDDTEENH